MQKQGTDRKHTDVKSDANEIRCTDLQTKIGGQHYSGGGVTRKVRDASENAQEEGKEEEQGSLIEPCQK